MKNSPEGAISKFISYYCKRGFLIVSLEVCKKCVDEQKKLYKCSKCSQTLCMHHYRTHKCSDPNLGLRGERSARLNASVTKNAWEEHIRKNKSFKIEIRDDFSFIIDFPWYPFTQLKAWAPATRENYLKKKLFLLIWILF